MRKIESTNNFRPVLLSIENRKALEQRKNLFPTS